MKVFEVVRPKMQRQDQTDTNDQVQTDTRDGVQDTVASLFRNFMDAAHKNDLTISPEQESKVKTALSTKVLSSAETRQKLAGLSAPSPEVAMQAVSHLMDIAGLDLKDTISDEQAARNAGHSEEDFQRPQPVDPDNLPAVINKSLKAAGKMEVEFSQVKHLPGYLREPIRAMGRQVFKVFTNTPIEDISVLANLNGMGGPNEISEINAVAGYARQHGTKDRQAELNFDQSIPGYEAEVAVFNTDETTFMLVKDFMGSYVYSWPSQHTKRLKESARSEKVTAAFHRLAKDLRLKVGRRGKEHVSESRMSELHSIVKDAEERAYDEASESRSAVSGDAIMKHVKAKLKRMHQGDPTAYLAAMRAAEHYVGKEHGGNRSLKEAHPRTQAAADRVGMNEPKEDRHNKPKLKRQGQRSGRNLKSKYGIGHRSGNVGKTFADK